MKHTKQELAEWQALPLSIKILMTQERIRNWVREYGEEGCYVSFSGGKDSTVLLDIVRNRMGYKDIPAVFMDTGLEYPEIRDFVRTFVNVVWLKPKMTFKQVIEKYGYPLISKEVSFYIQQLQAPQTEKNEKTRNLRLYGIRSDGKKVKVGKLPNKYMFLVGSRIKISNMCCDIMKKNPAHSYAHETGRHPITAQMASESAVRARQWFQNGCNAFDLKEPISNPMAFWTDQDVLQYIKENGCDMIASRVMSFKKENPDVDFDELCKNNEQWFYPICSVYGDVIQNDDSLKTTGCQRTGCMFCGYGCHMEKPGEGRFELMKQTHPKQYDYIMRPKEQGGLAYNKVFDYMNQYGNMNIRY